jgi:TolA-binding protein
VCAACRREVQALEALADALRASAAGGAPADELHRLRERTRLIAAFDATLVAPRATEPVWRTPGRRWAWGAAVAVVLVAVGAGGIWRFVRAPEGLKTEPTPAVVVQAGAATAWTKSSDGAGDRIVLERGDLWIRVDHSRQKGRLVVELPDGELEDTGTTFTVSAAGGHTARVAVQEGSVILRLAGRPAVTIGSGQTWRAAPSAPAATPPEPAATREGAPPTTASASTAVAAERKARGPSRALPSPPAAVMGRPPAPTGVAEGPAAGESDPAAEFRAAVAALDIGAHGDAADAFARFLSKHAHDPRAEDAAYLRVVALQRAGATGEMRRAAGAYLQMFPRGFRRTEIEALAQAPDRKRVVP